MFLLTELPGRGEKPTPFRAAGKGEPIVLLHPFALTWHAWDAVIDNLADDHRVLALTMAGHWGGPPIEHDRLALEHIVDAVEADMDAAGLQTAHVAGNSLGGWVGLELARRGRARSLVAIAPAGGWVHGSRSAARLRRSFLINYPLAKFGPALASRVTPEKLQQKALALMCHRPENLDPMTTRMLLRAPGHCDAYLPFVAAARRDGAAGRLHEITVPVTVLTCEHDKVLPRRLITRLVTEIDGARQVVLPNVGHVPMPEAPHLVAAAIRLHLGNTAIPGT